MKLIWLGLLTTAAFFWACEEVIVPGDPPQDFAITLVEAPQAINIRSGGDTPVYAIAYRVTHPEGNQSIQSVRVNFSSNGSQVFSLPLVDTGGLDPDTKDVLAGDGIYSNTFPGDSTIFPAGDITLIATAEDLSGSSLSTGALTLLALSNRIPIIADINVPTLLPSGSAALTFSITVQDSNEAADITGAEMQLRRGGSEIANFPMMLASTPAPDSAVFTLSVDSSFAVGRSGLYQLGFAASDAAGEQADLVERDITLENLATTLSLPSLPDTVELPLAGFSDTLHVKVSAADPQSLLDVDEVNFTVTLMGGTPSSPILMFDDGNPNPGNSDNGDLVANDGRYSRVISLSSSNTPGTYIFTYFAADKAGNTATAITDTLELIPPAGGFEIPETRPLDGSFSPR